MYIDVSFWLLAKLKHQRAVKIISTLWQDCQAWQTYCLLFPWSIYLQGVVPSEPAQQKYILRPMELSLNLPIQLLPSFQTNQVDPCPTTVRPRSNKALKAMIFTIRFCTVSCLWVKAHRKGVPLDLQENQTRTYPIKTNNTMTLHDIAYPSLKVHVGE